ncbi:MAG: hydantoinase/oxoprolinase family protein [Candidatus Eremiobacteraeota bacterium]|nr:hydantoinase/oxoprolinase family protein [Candidatus Eremiobacteraeota bacterium]
MSSAIATCVVGVDVGGTFTDFVMLDERGEVMLGKVPSTPANQAFGIMDGLRAIAPDFNALERVAHGTTVSTNALLQGGGGPVGLITTAGFGDAIEIGRTRRMLPSVYDPSFVRPEPLVPRPLRFEVAERLAADGSVLVPLAENEVDDATRQLDTNVQSIAICFLHSWANPRHERRAEELLRAALPNAYVTTSSEVIPEFREYERFSTTVINAFLMPVMDRYLESLDRALREAGYAGRLTTMSSAGGTLDIATTRRLPVRTILSGPVGGVAGALWIASAAQLDRFITCDMGGTSTDACVVEGGRPARISETAFAGFPLKGSQFDINTVGAGGGSIAYTEADGILHVGPRSAGADPGPACYGRGGTEPTVTDANLVLGRLGTKRPLGGSVKLDRARAVAAIDALAQQLRMSSEELAEGIVQLAVTRMAGAIRAITVERGRDPADYTLMPFGGAGGMHGCDLADELGIRNILVPVAPGNLSALGLLASDLRHELVRTWVRPLDAIGGGEVRELIAQHERDGRELPMFAALDPERIRFEHAFDMRYARQAFEISVPFPHAQPEPDELRARFLDLYEHLYGHADQRGAIEVVTLRTAVIGVTDKPEPAKIRPGPGRPAPRGTRAVRFRGEVTPFYVFDRDDLGARDLFNGPAIIEEPNATTVVLPGWDGIVDEYGNLRLRKAHDG